MPTAETTVQETTKPTGETLVPAFRHDDIAAAVRPDITPLWETAPAPPPAPDKTPDDEAHDPERARALIDKLRPFEKQATKLQKELKEAQAALKAHADAELSETERLQKRVDELEPVAESATTLTEQLERSNKALSTYVVTLREGLPQSVLVLLDKSDIVEQLEWLAENREAIIGNDKEPDKPLTKGVPASPKANANGIPDDERRQRAANTWRG